MCAPVSEETTAAGSSSDRISVHKRDNNTVLVQMGSGRAEGEHIEWNGGGRGVAGGGGSRFFPHEQTIPTRERGGEGVWGVRGVMG
jgi:hypothetical protein